MLDFSITCLKFFFQNICLIINNYLVIVNVLSLMFYLVLRYCNYNGIIILIKRVKIYKNFHHTSSGFETTYLASPNYYLLKILIL